MSTARFSIGIDLGTTNSAMAFAPLQGLAATEVFSVVQWDTAAALTDAPTLPSFAYLPDAATAAQLAAQRTGSGRWIIGRLARRKAGETPGRVVHSAKSWLCHHTADRAAPFLPWGSDDIAADAKISPVHAAALVLNYLRGAWDARFADSGADFQFDAQEITLTVPASFDAVAQRLTLDAAAEAGFSDGVRLLEEPQAAFYNWLEANGARHAMWAGPAPAGAEAHHVLVVDVGGGTSDFSLFEVRRPALSGGAVPKIKRLAVSNHILLGGDNIDLAIAHLLEHRLVGDAQRLSGSQWEHLVARCRDVKEKALSGDGPRDEVFTVALPGRSSSLIENTLSAPLSRGELETLLFDGFFPECAATDRPKQTQGALKEWGLPFAADSAVTRHLAEFLSGRPPVDAVLFNGGSLYPSSLRARIAALIGRWQQTPPPLVLENAAPDLAVARGAAQFGRLLHQRAERIEAGAARAIFLEAHLRDAAAAAHARRTLVCILPRDAAPEQAFEIADLALELRVNRPVRFQIFSSTRHGRCQAGDVVALEAADFQALPPLQTVAKVDDPRRLQGGRSLPVRLSAKLSELGLLQVSCRSTDPSIPQSWPLDFDLRPDPAGGAAQPSAEADGGPAEANAPAEAIALAKMRIEQMFARKPDKRDKLTATRLLQSLEKILGLGKGAWNWVLVRTLWSSLEASIADRRHSVEHEETWLILAGFLLRPGFGAALDEARIDSLWRIRERGLCFPGKRIRLQEHILWRRVAGGLSRERQERVLGPELATLRQPHKDPPPELVRLAGALERIGHELKAELTTRFIARAGELARGGQHCAPYLGALGLLLNRAPLYAGPEAVVSPELVERAWQAFQPLDWSDPELAELQTLFLRAARVVDNRALDLPSSMRSKIAGKLEKAGVTPLRTARLRAFMPLERAERLGLFGEALPPGLILGEG